MKEKYFHFLCVAMVIIGFVFIGFLYVSEPRSLAEVTTKGQVAIGTYQINRAEFDLGLADFRRDSFPAARSEFDRADPEKRDPATQFYVAYSYYREGWGRFSNDDALFTQGLAAVNRVILLDSNFRSADETLVMKTPIELKNELEDGLKITTSDFNPLKLTRERK